MLRSVYLLRCNSCVNIYRKLVNTAYKESFQNRTLQHFKSVTKLQTPLPHTSQIWEEFFDSLLPRAQKTLENVYRDLQKLQTTNNELIHGAILDDIDSKCFSIVHTLKPKQIFDLLFKYIELYGNRVHTTYFYEKAISTLVEAAEKRLLNNHEMLQLLFYMSFNRDIGQYYIDDIRPFVNITNLSLLEKCVVADCFMKLDIQFTPSESEELESIMEDEFELLKKDPHLLVILCRALTSISAKEVLTLEKLTDAILTAEEPWDFKILCNLLNFYSKALLFEPKVIDLLVKDGIKALKQDLEYEIPKLELYDISKFLDGISMLGLSLTSDDKLVLKTVVEKRYSEYKQMRNLSFFINALLCLHILKCWSTKLLVNCFKQNVFEPVFYNKYLWRIEAKLKLLLTQIDMETTVKIPSSLNRQITSKFSPSENIINLEEICQKLVKKRIVQSVKIDCPIEALFIPGVTLEANDTIYHVDVLDNNTCLKNTFVPHGYMNLKIRLLPRLRMRQILVQENSLKNHQKVLKDIVNSIHYRRTSTFHHLW